MTVPGSNSPWLKALWGRRERTHNEESTHTSLLNVFRREKGKISPSLYIQVPLRNPRSEIRLLKVLPGTGEIIKCRLRSVRLANTGNYEGLSYHWSGDEVENCVFVNDVHVIVRRNLYDALRFLRHTKKPRVLWVDAICIDQECNEAHGEKSHQLQLMSRIYRQAQRTVAYVGREAVGSAGTHTLNRFVKGLLYSIRLLQQTEQWAHSLGTSAHYMNTQMRGNYNIPDNDYFGWRTLGDLVDSSWAGRLWVVQEAVVAHEVTIQCGPYSFDLEDIAAAYGLMWTLGVPEANGIQTHFKSLVAERAEERSGQQRTLLSLAIRHCLGQCTHPQDKIYALRGLASDVGPGMHDNNFDYEKSAEVVYTEFARDCMRLYRNLDILSALAAFHNDCSEGLPSWVPDWRVYGNTFVYRRPRPPPEPGACAILFTASGSTSTDPVFSEDGRKVRLLGHVLDTIVDVGDIRPRARTARDGVAHFVGWRNKIARCSHEKYYEPTGEFMIDVFYHTITMANLSKFLNDALAEYKAFDRNLLILADQLEVPYYVSRVKIAGQWEAVPPWMSVEESTVTSASRPSVNRRMVRTERGYLGLVHVQAKVGDKIALFRGGLLPLVIREQGEDWRVVGDGYVHGAMTGEKFEDGKCEPFWFS